MSLDYHILYNVLKKNPPSGWEVVRYATGPTGGVYLWPDIRPKIKEPAGDTDGRLGEYSILFEFHVTSGNYARLLARARFHTASAELDLRWAAWRHLALDHCLAWPVQESGDPKTTKSVGLWDGGDLRLINYMPPPDEVAVARILCNYLKSPPRSLLCFIAHL